MVELKFFDIESSFELVVGNWRDSLSKFILTFAFYDVKNAVMSFAEKVSFLEEIV